MLNLQSQTSNQISSTNNLAKLLAKIGVIGVIELPEMLSQKKQPEKQQQEQKEPEQQEQKEPEQEQEQKEPEQQEQQQEQEQEQGRDDS